MEFTVEFYKSHSGQCPIREFLDGLKESDPDDFATIMAGLAKLRNRQYHRPPLSKYIRDDLFELRHVGKLNTRVLFFSQKDRESLQCMVSGIRQEKSLKEILRLLCRGKRIGN